MGALIVIVVVVVLVVIVALLVVTGLNRLRTQRVSVDEAMAGHRRAAVAAGPT